MSAAYLSYSRHDHSAAELILHSLRDAGVTVEDTDDLIRKAPIGVSLPEYLYQHITAAQFFILLWSRAAAASQTTKDNIRHAIEAWSSGRLLLATLDDTELPLGLRDLAPVAVRIGTDGPDSRSLIDRARQIVREQAIPPPVAAQEIPLRRVRLHGPSRWRKRAVEYFLYALVALFLFVSAYMRSFYFGESFSDDLFRSVRPALRLAFAAAFILLVGAAIGALTLAIWQRARHRRSLAAAAKLISPSTSATSQTDSGQVFVSYSRRNQQIVDQVVQEIEQSGFPVWIDRKSTSSGRYAAPIVQAIKSCKLVALMCSQDAFSSDHVIREIYVAGDHKKPFIVFQIDQSEFPDDVLYFTSGFPRVPIADIDVTRLRSEINRLVAAL
jgi:hypothetical protein